MSEVEEVELSFWLGEYRRDYESPANGVSISDDGGKTYVNILNFNSDHSNLRVVVNLNEMVAEHGLTLNQNFRVKFQSSGSNSGYYGRGITIDDICIITELPEIEVQSNTIPITDGSLIPSTNNNTEFGAVSINGGRVEKTFTIHNTAGQGELLLQAIEVDGIHAEDFELVQQLEPMALQPDTVTTFDIAFSTAITALRQAVVKIFSNDSDESIYDFIIQGRGALIPSNTPTGLAEREEPSDHSMLYLPIIQR